MFPPRNADPVEFPLLLIFEARAGLRLFEALDPIRDVLNFLLANDPRECASFHSLHIKNRLSGVGPRPLAFSSRR